VLQYGCLQSSSRIKLQKLPPQRPTFPPRQFRLQNKASSQLKCCNHGPSVASAHGLDVSRLLCSRTSTRSTIMSKMCTRIRYFVQSQIAHARPHYQEDLTLSVTRNQSIRQTADFPAVFLHAMPISKTLLGRIISQCTCETGMITTFVLSIIALVE